MEYNDIPYFSRKNKAKFSKMISENQRNQRDTKKCTVANDRSQRGNFNIDFELILPDK